MTVARTVAKMAARAAEVAKVVVTKAVHPLLGHSVDHLTGRHLVGRLVGRQLVGYHPAEVVEKVMVRAGPNLQGRRAQQAAVSQSSPPRAADAPSSTGQPGAGRKGVASGGAAAARART
jgi:hypothetical protein